MEKLTVGGRTSGGNDASCMAMMSGGAATEGARITAIRAGAHRTRAEVPTIRAGAGSPRLVALVKISQPKGGR